MHLNIARWGDILALRIPADYARRIGIKEGDSVEAGLTVDGGIAIRPVHWNRKDFAQELAKTRDAMPMGTSAPSASVALMNGKPRGSATTTSPWKCNLCP